MYFNISFVYVLNERGRKDPCSNLVVSFFAFETLLFQAIQVRIPLKDPDKSCSELNNHNPLIMRRLKRKFNFTMFDEFFQFFLLWAAPSPPLNMSWFGL
jgi:hypothetical protein